MWHLCVKCEKILPLWQFYNSKKSLMGVGSYCKECTKLNSLKYQGEKSGSKKENEKRMKKYGNMTDEQIVEWNLDGYTGPQSKILKTENNKGEKVHSLRCNIDHSDYLELRKMKIECGLENMGFIFRTAISLIIKMYNEEDLPVIGKVFSRR